MKRILAFALMAAIAGNALASEIGIGISAKSDDALTYVPIDVSAKFRIEPSIRYVSSDFTSSVEFLFASSVCSQIRVANGGARNRSVRLVVATRIETG